MKQFALTIFSILIFVRCTDNYPEEFYGTYEIADSFNIRFEKINFYRDNHYSFYASSCLDGSQDTGEFHLKDGIVTFKSYKPKDTSEFQNFDRRLTKYKFNYSSGKICFLRSTNPTLKSGHNDPDTMMNLPKKN